ncbi:MAG: glycoside hydrolase, partial [Proteobacteria bacterium]
MRTFFSFILLIIISHFNAIANNPPGSGLLPVPRKVALTNEKYTFDKTWAVTYSGNIKADDASISSLINGINDKFDIDILVNGQAKKRISLIIKANSIKIGNATDTNRAELTKQAYRIKLEQNTVTITANASAGLYYGVQTFLQLLSKENENVTFNAGTIEDWPDLEMRIIYWDDAHHLEKIKALKRAIKQAAHYKINGFAIKLEGHFQYKIAKPIIEPYAYT